MAGSAALVAYLGWRSLGWPLIHDAPLMHYIAWVIAQGGVPYRDVFDMNMPGPYLIHWAVLAIGGPGDLAWRLFDLAWLGATALLLWLYARPRGVAPALAGALLFALYHLSGGAWRVGQRDFLLCAFLLAGVYGVARSIERGGALWPLGWGGIAFGAGMMVKPHAGLLWLGASAVAALAAWRAGRSPLVVAAVVLGAGLVIPVIVLGWLASRGGLAAFAAVLTGYVLPLYSQVGRTSVLQAVAGYYLGWLPWLLLGGLAALGVATPAPSGAGARKALAALGAVAGALHFFLQHKGWEYQLYPLAVFLCALAPFALGRPAERDGAASRVPGTGRTRRRAALDLATRAAALGVLAVSIGVLGVKGVDALEPAWIADKARRVAAVTRDLRRVAPADGTIQVMDVTEGGVHALFNLGRRQPTRFIYDLHFFHDEGDPRIRALRAEFVEALRAGRPADIVIFRDTWNRRGYDRVSDWPELEGLLAQSYTLAVDGDAYRIYARRSGA